MRPSSRKQEIRVLCPREQRTLAEARREGYAAGVEAGVDVGIGVGLHRGRDEGLAAGLRLGIRGIAETRGIAPPAEAQLKAMSARELRKMLQELIAPRWPRGKGRRTGAG